MGDESGSTTTEVNVSSLGSKIRVKFGPFQATQNNDFNEDDGFENALFGWKFFFLQNQVLNCPESQLY